MPNLIGTAPNQVPTNGALGNMAFQNKEAVSVDTLVTTALTVTGTGALTVGGTQIVKDASGNLGVGVTPSAWDTFKVLQVGNGAIASPLFSNTIVTANAYYGSGSLRYIASSSPASVFQQADGIFYWRTAPSGTAGNAISFTQAMTLDASGNLGVGTGTPGYRLDVSQSGSAGAVIDVARIFANAGSTATPRLLFGSGANEVSAAIGAQTTTATTGDLTFYTETAGALTEKARIDSAGNVGIGTSSPGDKLTVNGFVSATAGAYSSTNGGNAVKFGAAGQMNFGAGGSDLILTTNAGNIRFGNWNTNTEYARIDSSGNLGVDTTSPTAKLDVNADTVRVRTAKTPASATATGNAGDICWDSNYVYVCVATNTWKRSALSTW